MTAITDINLPYAVPPSGEALIMPATSLPLVPETDAVSATNPHIAALQEGMTARRTMFEDDHDDRVRHARLIKECAALLIDHVAEEVVSKDELISGINEIRRSDKLISLEEMADALINRDQQLDAEAANNDLARDRAMATNDQNRDRAMTEAGERLSTKQRERDETRAQKESLAAEQEKLATEIARWTTALRAVETEIQQDSQNFAARQIDPDGLRGASRELTKKRSEIEMPLLELRSRRATADNRKNETDILYSQLCQEIETIEAEIRGIHEHHVQQAQSIQDAHADEAQRIHDAKEENNAQIDELTEREKRAVELIKVAGVERGQRRKRVIGEVLNKIRQAEVEAMIAEADKIFSK